MVNINTSETWHGHGNFSLPGIETEPRQRTDFTLRASVLLSGITRKDVLKHLESFDTFPELTFDSKYFVEVFVKVRLSRLMFEFYDLES